MQITETLSEGLKREYRIVVPAGDIEGRIDKKLDELAGTASIKGFRPGKAPRPVLRRRFGKSVRSEVLRDTIEASWRQAMTDRGVRPALIPSVDVTPPDPGADLEFTLALEALPDFDPVDVKGLKLERLTAEVSEERVQRSLEELAAAEKDFGPAESGHAARPGDALRISFEGAIDGEEFAGGSAGNLGIVLGAGSFIPGFEDGLIGVREGETRDVRATFPEDSSNKELAGKTAVFSVSVSEVSVPVEVPVDDALAARLGLADLEALRAAMRERRQSENRALARLQLKRQILDKLADGHDFGVPDTLVENEFKQIWQQIETDMDRAGVSWSDPDRDEEAERKDYRAIAERRVRLGLILTEIGKRNGITVPQDELNRAVTEHARRYPGKEREIFDMFRSNPEMMNHLHAPLLEDKVVDFIVEMAEVTEREVSETELLASSDDDADGGKGDNAGGGEGGDDGERA